ncbi:TORTIFOLIA1-like protein 3 [Cornus florida]|uniref:TORTIFOLIA1-like protein 3 n=1 Tax=Cornus florida TaxID=4283 RepID=UPI00289E1F2A|nr:TORTIFOLIA1-like protein 3 [Cornus florida]
MLPHKTTMAIAKHASPRPNLAESTRELKHRVLTCLNKLSDRDTHSAAASELESIANSLTLNYIPSFISSISATDTDKSPVRRQCVRLISVLSESHGDALSPFLCKLISAVVRRLRDTDSAVRSACVTATASISSHITKPPFTLIMKPFIDSLVTEQDQNSQIGASLCLASAIDASPDPEPLYLKRLLPRLEKLLKNPSFKAKPALLTLIASIIGSGAASSQQVLKILVPCLVEFVRSENWAARKAAAEALVKLAVVERETLSEFRSSCLKTFEATKFDKVKSVRVTMNQLIDAWKEIPNVSNVDSGSPDLEPSSKEDVSDGRYPPGSKTSCTVTPGAPQIRKKNIPCKRSSLPDGSITTTARKRSPLDISDKKSGPAMFRKLDRKKPTDWKIEISSPHTSSMIMVEDESEDWDEKAQEKGEEEGNRIIKGETKRALFDKNVDDRLHKCGGFKAGSHVVPCHGEKTESTVVVSNLTEDLYRNQKESEDLSLIRKQLGQIENQQSSLLDLLQKFMGSSQNGMRSLETRVHGLEVALDEISFDLARSTGRMSNTDSKRTTCCKLPGAEFLRAKLWRKSEGRYSTSPSSGITSVSGIRNMANNNGSAEPYKLENRRLRLHGAGGLIVNPLAEIQSNSPGISAVSSNRTSKNVHVTV